MDHSEVQRCENHKGDQTLVSATHSVTPTVPRGKVLPATIDLELVNDRSDAIHIQETLCATTPRWLYRAGRAKAEDEESL